MLSQEMFENAYQCFPVTRLIIKTQLKEIHKKH